MTRETAWSLANEANRQIASLNLSGIEELASSISCLFRGTNDFGYSGIVVSNDEASAAGVDVEASCYAHGGLVFLYKSYDLSVLVEEVPHSSFVTLLKHIGHSYLSNVAKEPNVYAELDVAWAVCQRDGDYGTMHNHVPPGSYPDDRFSGMLYLTTPDCVNPRTFPNGCLHIVVDNKAHYFPPIPGSVVIWPSWMMHGIHPFRGEGDRLGIAFDFIKRSLEKSA